MTRSDVPARDPAAARFAAIQVVRAIGVALVLVGILIDAGRLEAFAGAPSWIGYLLIAAGLFAAFIGPVLLARRWRSPRP
jgi:hypothetical protein